ncbi:hypothetical protein DES49_0644 [Halospina denitrificans]|uniref:DUF1269 domain-containing protein n=1 Tax=Halospina denitrificans TaxID=332522 RepID=A0A4R7K2B7_9GAMM|nr:hypothetical protein [Halospina denitrificans]TDT44534.1 hypothetical protein DES49_0644 [Halospina denitrificans]
MKRLFYLVDQMDSVESISEDLHNEGITDWRFHVLSRDEAGLFTRKLHSASIFDRTDLARYTERGAIAGALFAMAFIVTAKLTGALVLPAVAWVALFLFMTAAGAWLAGFGGIGVENYRIRRFHDAIENGQHLVMVDVRKKDEQRMKELMASNHPDAQLQSEDSAFNNPLVEEDGKVHIL